MTCNRCGGATSPSEFWHQTGCECGLFGSLWDTDVHIVVSPFCKGIGEQFLGTSEELVSIVRSSLTNSRKGYRIGVALAPVPPEKFRASVRPLGEGDTFQTSFVPRYEGEEPVLDVRVVGEPVPAVAVDVVLYHHRVLKEDGDASIDDPRSWEIIAILPRSSEEETPMHPVTMARNFLHRKGGTAGTFSAEEFAQAIWYWATHANVAV